MKRVATNGITALLFLICALPLAAWAQGVDLSKPFQLQNELGEGAFADNGAVPAGQELFISAQFQLAQGKQEGRLLVRAEMAPDWHVYSLDQPKKGAKPSVLTIEPSDVFDLTGAFKPDKPPKVREHFGATLHEHYKSVVWSAPIKLSQGADPKSLTISGSYKGLCCHDEAGCRPQDNRPFKAEFAGYYESQSHAAPAGDQPADAELGQAEPVAGDTVAAQKPAQAPPVEGRPTYSGSIDSHAVLTGEIITADAAPGGKLVVNLSATVNDPNYHVYAYEQTQPPKAAYSPTLILISKPKDWNFSTAAPSKEPDFSESYQAYWHEGEVAWKVEVDIPAETQPGVYRIEGVIGYQTCSSQLCDPPQSAKFAADVEIAAQPEGGLVGLLFSEGPRYREVAEQAEATWGGQAAAKEQQGPASVIGESGEWLFTHKAGGTEYSFWFVILLAFVGGFILNFMPCVLPVIGLKVMSFVQQAGESNRGRIFALNAWYAGGLLAVFMALALLSIVWNFGWGEQNSFSAFNIILASVIFTMALSFIGVWEIPIPGFVGSGKAVDLAEQEGPAGAFFKGVLTTLVAVPCSGPGIATAFAWLNGKPPVLVLLVYSFMAMGMAMPYLVLGAVPGLIRLLPKPGAWMETFKQVMGFVLLGTVLWIMTYIPLSYLVPTVAFMFALWAACWFIGSTPVTAETQTKATRAVAGVVFAAIVGLFAFSDGVQTPWVHVPGLHSIAEARLDDVVNRRLSDMTAQLGENDGIQPASEPDENTLPWESFNKEKLARYTSEGKTVLVDFTADWCLTCKFLESTVLNTENVREVVDRNEVVTLVADWTDRGPEIGGLLNALGSKQVPVVAIFPADRPQEPIVIIGGYSQATLMEKLAEAGPSNGAVGGQQRGDDATPVAARSTQTDVQ